MSQPDQKASLKIGAFILKKETVAFFKGDPFFEVDFHQKRKDLLLLGHISGVCVAALLVI